MNKYLGIILIALFMVLLRYLLGFENFIITCFIYLIFFKEKGEK